MANNSDSWQNRASVTPESKPALWNSDYTKAWTANFMLYFSFMLIVPILPLYLSDTYLAGKHTIGFVLSGYTIAIMLVRPFSGYLVDSFDRRRVLLVFYGLSFLLCGFYLLGGSLLFFTILRTIHGAPYGATIIGVCPSGGIVIYELSGNSMRLFALSMLVAGVGLYIASRINIRPRRPVESRKLSLDRFFLVRGWRQAVIICCFGLSYGVHSTYLAIYGKERLGITGGTGL